jgi:hypothetical protein
VVVLDVEVRSAFDAPAAVALEDGEPDISGDDLPPWDAGGACGHGRVGSFELALLTTLPVTDERQNVVGPKQVVLPVEAVLEEPVNASLGRQNRRRLDTLRFLQCPLTLG